MKNDRPTIFVPHDAGIFVPGSVRAEMIGQHKPKRQHKPKPPSRPPGTARGPVSSSRQAPPLRQGSPVKQGPPAKVAPPLRQGTPAARAPSTGPGRHAPPSGRREREKQPPPWEGLPPGPARRRAERWPRWLPYREKDAENEDGGGGPSEPMAVPPEIQALAERAAAQWKMNVSGWKLAATKPEKGWGAIWRIETDQGPRSFKLLHRPFERNRFSIYAQEYLTSRKARVAPLVPARDGQLYAIVEGRMFIVTEWIQGLHPATKLTPDGAAALCYGIGEFHRLSRGYEPPADAYFATRMHRWPGVYRKMRTKIDWFEHLAQSYPEMPASPLLLQVLPRFRQQADDAIALLERSAYKSLVAQGEKAWGLVHQGE
jgi:hypothetical protein